MNSFLGAGCIILTSFANCPSRAESRSGVSCHTTKEVEVRCVYSSAHRLHDPDTEVQRSTV